VRRAQGATLAALAAGVVVTAVALSSDDRSVETIPPASGPTSTTALDDPTRTASPELPGYFRVAAFRAQGPFLTVAMLWDQGLAGFDPCTDLRPQVVETSEEITVELVDDDVEEAAPWAACGTGSMGSWGTVEMDDAVGARTVNGRAVIDGSTLLLPDDLPAPFEVERREEAGTRHSVPGEDGSLTGMWSWSFSWRAGMSELRLSINEPPSSDECDGESEDVAVRGTTAHLCRGPVAENYGVRYLLQWEDGGRPINIGYSSSLDPAHLTVDDLLAIAEGLEPIS
jgi:hypothetical protein